MQQSPTWEGKHVPPPNTLQVANNIFQTRAHAVPQGVVTNSEEGAIRPLMHAGVHEWLLSLCECTTTLRQKARINFTYLIGIISI